MLKRPIAFCNLDVGVFNPKSKAACLFRPAESAANIACERVPKTRLLVLEQQSQTTKEKIFMANPFVHVELNTTDVPKAKAFYGTLFGWKLEDMPMPSGTYTMINVGEGTGGGIMQHPMPGAPSSWLAYVLVDDIAAATEKAKSLGATVIKEVTEVMGAGWLSIIVDPTGAALGLWKPSGS
jgi:predicted enzyme related to lactoylglutathione lyase